MEQHQQRNISIICSIWFTIQAIKLILYSLCYSLPQIQIDEILRGLI